MHFAEVHVIVTQAVFVVEILLNVVRVVQLRVILFFFHVLVKFMNRLLLAVLVDPMTFP